MVLSGDWLRCHGKVPSVTALGGAWSPVKSDFTYMGASVRLMTFVFYRHGSRLCQAGSNANALITAWGCFRWTEKVHLRAKMPVAS